jgi:hypothetical protein
MYQFLTRLSDAAKNSDILRQICASTQGFIWLGLLGAKESKSLYIPVLELEKSSFDFPI